MRCDPERFKEYNRLVKEGKIQSKLAARALGYTPERFCVLRRKYEAEGDRIFTHGSKGRPARNAVPDSTRRFIAERYLLESHPRCPINFTYWRDELEEVHGIKLSYRTVYNILSDAGIDSPEGRKPDRKPVKRIRFKRKHFGELVQWDATPYQWFAWAGDTRYYALHGALDDATSSFLGMRMTEFECRYGYIECRRQILSRYGIELEDYSDKSPVFHNNYKEQEALSVDDQLAGTTKKKPLWEVMDEELGVVLNLANSPQAKGKIERAWETVQGRLPNEFKKRGIKTVADANAFLGEFIEYYNAHFAKPAESNVPVFRPVPKSLDVDNILCVKEKRTVSKNGTVSFKGLKLRVKGIERAGLVGDVCVNERGLWFLRNGKSYPLEVASGIHELSANAPQSLESIIHDFMFAEVHEHAA